MFNIHKGFLLYMLDHLLRTENKYFLRSFLEFIMHCILLLHAVADQIFQVHPHKFIDRSRVCKIG